MVSAILALFMSVASATSPLGQKLGITDKGLGTGFLGGLVRLYGDGHVGAPSVFEGITWKFETGGSAAYPLELGGYIGQSNFNIPTDGPATGELSFAVQCTFLTVFGGGAGMDFYEVGKGFQKFGKNTFFIFVSASPTNPK